MKNGMEIDKDGTKIWYLNGALHREDGPACEWADGSKIWYLNGKLHRVDGPAWEYADGETFWYLNGLKHREDGPAQEWSDGNKFWYLNGLKHRVDGPASEWTDGSKEWYLNGVELIHPELFDTMDEWFEYLNDNEEQTYQVIHEIKGIIETIKNPSAKQTRVHQMAHML